MKHRELIEELSKLQTSHYGCGSVYCGGCGGLVLAMRRNMTAKLRSDINTALLEMSVSDFKGLGDWGEFFQEIDPAGVISIFEREAIRIDTSDIRAVDRYLLDARKFVRTSSEYKELLEQGINTAIQTSDESLIETISIVLGENILNHEELLSLALRKSEFNRGINRVLYNFLREKVPEVRGFVGDGINLW